MDIYFRCLVLIDVEGLFCPEKQNPDHDLKTFALAVLSSSVLIVNNMRSINLQGLETLSLLSKLSTEFIKTSGNPNQFSDHFPTLVWAIRDVLK